MLLLKTVVVVVAIVVVVHVAGAVSPTATRPYRFVRAYFEVRTSLGLVRVAIGKGDSGLRLPKQNRRYQTRPAPVPNRPPYAPNKKAANSVSTNDHFGRSSHRGKT